MSWEISYPYGSGESVYSKKDGQYTYEFRMEPVMKRVHIYMIDNVAQDYLLSCVRKYKDAPAETLYGVIQDLLGFYEYLLAAQFSEEPLTGCSYLVNNDVRVTTIVNQKTRVSLNYNPSLLGHYADNLLYASKGFLELWKYL